MAAHRTANMTIAEMREFASFSERERGFIARSLDIGLGRGDAFSLWSGSEDDNVQMRQQFRSYRALPSLRRAIPEDTMLDGVEGFMGMLIRVTACDLSFEKIGGFPAYRFLYERLLGAGVRPWLPAGFCGASALPQIKPEQRKILLQSLSEAAATAPGWSVREPAFLPETLEEAVA